MKYEEGKEWLEARGFVEVEDTKWVRTDIPVVALYYDTYPLGWGISVHDCWCLGVSPEDSLVHIREKNPNLWYVVDVINKVLDR